MLKNLVSFRLIELNQLRFNQKTATIESKLEL